ncbi:hypothetical protein DFJ73DRAFT_123421 [Zopfochytrium polystomum]|nr:hypothetical protein DFJ73DRAFT_123421 [Zopfochytrium polystomum]
MTVVASGTAWSEIITRSSQTILETWNTCGGFSRDPVFEAPPTPRGSLLGNQSKMRKRQECGPGKLVEANSMIWMTDRTPHESVPIEVPGAFRQYFRLVTSQVSVWYEEHSTKNELGIVPPKKVVIVKGNKFSDSERSKAGSMGTRPFPSSNYLATVRGSAEFLKQGEALWELFTRLNLHDRQECGQNNIDGSLEVQSALVKWLQMLPSKFQLSLNEEDISERMTTMENSAWCGQSTLFILFHGIMCCSSLRTRVWSINSASRVAKDNNTERNKPKERPDTNDVSNKSASAAVGTGTLPDIRGLIYETKANINDRVETASVVALESAEAVCTLLAMIQRSVSYAANFPMLKSTKLSGKSKRKAKSGQSSSVGSGSGGVGPRNGVPPEDFVRSVWSPSSSASLWLLVVEAAVTIFISTLTAVDSSSVLQGVQPYTDEATNYLKNVTSFFRTFVGYRLERSIRRLIELLDEPQKLSVEVACNVAIATIEEAVAVANGCNDDDFDGESGPSKEDRNVKTPPLMALEQSLLKMADVARKIGIAQVFK